MTRKLQFRSVKGRLTFWFLVAALVPLLIVSGVVSYQRVNAIKEIEFNKLIAIRNFKVDQVNRWLDERIGDIQIISGDPEIRALEQLLHRGEPPQGDYGTLLKGKGLLNRYVENYQAYDELFIINPVTGKIIISTDKALIGEKKSQDLYFTEPMRTRKACIKDIYFSQTLNRPSMAFSIPIFCASHGTHIVGILVARINLENSLFDLLLDRTGMGETGETLIVNKDVVALNQLRWHERASLKLRISAKPALLAAQGKTGIVETTDYRGEKVLAAYTYIPRTKWGFVAKQDLKEVYAPIRSMLWDILILVSLSGVIVYGLALFLAKTIARPVHEMTEVSKRIGAGDVSARNRVVSADEFGFLSESFNAMADSVISQIEIQEAVAEITATMVEARKLDDFRKNLLRKLVEVTGSNMGAYFLNNPENNTFEHFTSIGISPEILEPFDASILEGELGQPLATKRISHIKNIPGDTLFTFKTFTGAVLPKEIITIPIVIEDVVVSIISLANLNTYSKESAEILNQVWAGMNTGISNLRANEKTRRLAEELEGKNQELQSQTEELQAQTEELQQQSEELQAQTEELEAQREQVEVANRLKSEFLANMSHELRTPLNSVMALSRVLMMQAKEKLSEEELNYLEIILRNGQNLLSLINDILDLSKIEAGRMDVTPKLFSITSTIKIIMERLEPVAEEKGIDMKREIPDNLPNIQSDEARVHQVLQNLMGNALKFTAQGSVTVSARSDAEKIYIRVADTGIGISAKNLPHIFQEFRQIDGTSARPYEGTGLGLAIAHRTTEMLSGKLTVQSTLGKGSTFTLILPVKWPGLIPDAGPFAVTTPGRITPAQKTVLVVDDDPDVLTMISESLSREGYNTLTATSGEEALRLAREHRPFAITLDVIMPEMDGWEVLQHLKEDSVTKDIPVIIVSVSDDKETGVALGAVGYVTKPVNRTLLIAEINRIDGPTPHRILLVEDNEVAVIQVKSILEGEGYSVDVANGGHEAIEYIEHTIPDGIILDLMMPQVDGFEVLEKLRSSKRTAMLPVLVLTAKDLTPEDLSKLTANNIQQLVQKGDVDREGLLFKTHLMLGAEARLKVETGNWKLKNRNSQPATILVVEDNPDNMTTIKAMLQNKYTILEATDGEEGLKMALSELPDLVLLDMSLPKLDGFEVVGKIKADEKARNIPVIALTARAMKGDRERTIDAGCDDYISKPVDPEEVLKKIMVRLEG